MADLKINEREVAFSPAWFDEAFKHAETPIPEDIRNAAVNIIVTHDIRGICDPMYVANSIALFMQRGNGRGFFEQGRTACRESNEVLLDRTATRLAFSYSCSQAVTKSAMHDALLKTLQH